MYFLFLSILYCKRIALTGQDAIVCSILLVILSGCFLTFALYVASSNSKYFGHMRGQVLQPIQASVSIMIFFVDIVYFNRSVFVVLGIF